MIETLVKTLQGNNNEVYAITGGQRLRLASCNLNICIYEQSQSVTAIGVQGYQFKVNNAATVECSDIDATRNVDIDFVKKVSRFEIQTDVQRSDGIFERIVFDNLLPREIGVCGNWEFIVVGQRDLINRLADF